MLQIETGFAQPVHHAQHCFRQILKAFSEPGSRVSLNKHRGFAPLNPAASQVIMSLCDQHTGLYLSPELAKPTDLAHAVANLAFHNGVQRTTLQQADFVVINSTQTIDLMQCKAGSDMSPEHSAMLLVQTEDLDSGPRFRLSGPGIQHPIIRQFGELGASLLDYLSKPSHHYPLGLEFVFCHQQSLLAISRTTQLERI
ncbi:phosphonate C-P lyase system protein PhnH [Agarivorans sp. QJM3NY_33]|uniref:phosphonate C-P lyase system protein PhnH n=1 Tax=Agarivorans sp. QJM3NY_33 TaxID=3421432 RepID=UPI003D7E4E2C